MIKWRHFSSRKCYKFTQRVKNFFSWFYNGFEGWSFLKTCCSFFANLSNFKWKLVYQSKFHKNHRVSREAPVSKTVIVPARKQFSNISTYRDYLQRISSREISSLSHLHFESTSSELQNSFNIWCLNINWRRPVKLIFGKRQKLNSRVVKWYRWYFWIF